jgi:hypothetical protein
MFIHYQKVPPKKIYEVWHFKVAYHINYITVPYMGKSKYIENLIVGLDT